MCLIGMWKAFNEMERSLDWIAAAQNDRRPGEGCQPIVRAFAEAQARARVWEDARTVAAGLRVPTRWRFWCSRFCARAAAPPSP